MVIVGLILTININAAVPVGQAGMTDEEKLNLMLAEQENEDYNTLAGIPRWWPVADRRTVAPGCVDCAWARDHGRAQAGSKRALGKARRGCCAGWRADFGFECLVGSATFRPCGNG